jgi:hypothetical protein
MNGVEIIMGTKQTKYIDAFKKEHYDRILFRIPKGRKAELKEYATIQDLSINQLILYAVEKYTKLDLHTPIEQDKDD